MESSTPAGILPVRTIVQNEQRRLEELVELEKQKAHQQPPFRLQLRLIKVLKYFSTLLLSCVELFTVVQQTPLVMEFVEGSNKTLSGNIFYGPGAGALQSTLLNLLVSSYVFLILHILETMVNTCRSLPKIRQDDFSLRNHFLGSTDFLISFQIFDIVRDVLVINYLQIDQFLYGLTIVDIVISTSFLITATVSQTEDYYKDRAETADMNKAQQYRFLSRKYNIGAKPDEMPVLNKLYFDFKFTGMDKLIVNHPIAYTLFRKVIFITVSFFLVYVPLLIAFLLLVLIGWCIWESRCNKNLLDGISRTVQSQEVQLVIDHPGLLDRLKDLESRQFSVDMMVWYLRKAYNINDDEELCLINSQEKLRVIHAMNEHYEEDVAELRTFTREMSRVLQGRQSMTEELLARYSWLKKKYPGLFESKEQDEDEEKSDSGEEEKSDFGEDGLSGLKPFV